MMMHITERKDGRFMGRFVIGQKKGGKKIYQYVYGKTYEEALQKVQIGMEIESQYRHRKHITVLEVYQEWIVAVANRVKESSYANYRTKFEKHIILGSDIHYLSPELTDYGEAFQYDVDPK